ncbi:PadR family transcriptional regulator [Natrinema amylolyticum]|uniref:PadR family transcriptional regulator n=1 Tax=Natrinema amylolyticum TaxID=2878679 RepID=UPI001CFB52E7|nr:PadR family transcriptional regulator [Natrinema amylolyticum]
MHDDDSRDLEPPARADASPSDDPITDDRRAWVDLTGFQRDCLEAIARCERDDRSRSPAGLIATLERRYPTVSRARLEPTLRALVARDLVATRGGRPGRTTAYRLTGAGRALLVQRADRLAALCELRDSAVDEGTEPAAREDRRSG